MTADILLDARGLSGRSGVRGIGTYARGLVEGLCAVGAGPRLVLLRRPGDPLPADLAEEGVRAGPEVMVTKRRLQPLVDPLLVSRAVRRAAPALYHGLEWGQPALPGGVPVVTTVHDLIPWLRGSHYRWQRRERVWAIGLLRRADAVITPSRSAAAEVVAVAGVKEARVHVIPHGVDRRFRPVDEATSRAVLTRLGVPGSYVLAVGTQEPRKRLDVAVAAVRALRDGGHPVCLVVAGEQGAYAAAAAAALAPLGAGARLLGHVALDDLVALYTAAEALLFTSDHEGFGLPLVEAMACGCPVVAVEAIATGEAAGGAALLARPGDGAALVRHLERVLDDPGLRGAQVHAGTARAAALTWERSAAAHLALYDATLAGTLRR